MTKPTGKIKKISLGDDFGAVAIKVNGVCIEVQNDGTVSTYTNGPVHVKPAAASKTAVTAGQGGLRVGDTMPDGSIFAGVSPVNGKQMFAMPADDGEAMVLGQANWHTKEINKAKVLGHDDWRLPNDKELNILFKNRNKGALKGTFNLSGGSFTGWYLSSTPGLDGLNGYTQRFSDGAKHIYGRRLVSSVRYIR